MKLKYFWLGSLIAFIITMYLRVTFGSPAFQSLDGKAFYTTEYAISFFKGLGPAGRAAYIRGEIIDFFIVIFYTTFALLSINLKFSNIDPLKKYIKWCYLCALTPGIFDTLENSLILWILSRYPILDISTIKYLPFLTSTKWSMGVVLLLVFITLFLKSKKTLSV
ncbi:MAG: hypothetical protein ISR65_13285 [Bacteriovoracaceae bacterium]|nr:hypothetical protein [Bacteriovoracaceae bacterium]